LGSNNFVRSESGQIKSVKLVSNRTQHPPPPPREGKEGRVEKVREATVLKTGSKIPT
jgi:hypothetical protein